LKWEIRHSKKHFEEFYRLKKIISIEISIWDTLNFTLLDTSLVNQGINPRKMIGKEDYKMFDSIFGIDHLKSQINNQTDTVFNQKEFGFRISDTRKKHKNRIHYYSLPLFSKDKIYVLCRHWFQCGNVCGYGFYGIYKRTSNGKWKIDKIIRNSIS
jgi:hypothetical protein